MDKVIPHLFSYLNLKKQIKFKKVLYFVIYSNLN